MPAACVPCDTRSGNPVATCVRCESNLDHRHVRLIDRHGVVVAEASLCATCVTTFVVHGRPLTDYLNVPDRT